MQIFGTSQCDKLDISWLLAFKNIQTPLESMLHLTNCYNESKVSFLEVLKQLNKIPSFDSKVSNVSINSYTFYSTALSKILSQLRGGKTASPSTSIFFYFLKIGKGYNFDLLLHLVFILWSHFCQFTIYTCLIRSYEHSVTSTW